MEFARTVGRITFNDVARETWESIYRGLSEGGLGVFGSVTSRAESQVLRLSSLYALLDCQDQIGPKHLAAGLAVWAYCEQSARYIFSGSTGNPVADQILIAFRGHPEGMTLTQLSDHFNHNRTSKEIRTALALLKKHGLARKVEPLSGEKKGRKAEIWAPCANTPVPGK